MLFGEKVKNKKGLLDLTLLLPSLQRNMEEKAWSTTLLSRSEAPFAEAKWMITVSLHSQVQRTCMGAHFVIKTTDFIATLSLSLTLTASLEYQTIHTGQSLSGPFWNGLVLSAITYLSLTFFFSETQPGHWRIISHAHGATTHQLNGKTWPKVRIFLRTLKLCRHSCVS